MLSIYHICMYSICILTSVFLSFSISVQDISRQHSPIPFYLHLSFHPIYLFLYFIPTISSRISSLYIYLIPSISLSLFLPSIFLPSIFLPSIFLPSISLSSFFHLLVFTMIPFLSISLSFSPSPFSLPLSCFQSLQEDCSIAKLSR